MQKPQGNFYQTPYKPNQYPIQNYPINGQQNPIYNRQKTFPQSPYLGQNITNDIPEFKMISMGKGIDRKELYVITHAALSALKNREDPLSDGIISRIKSQIRGEWMVFVSLKDLIGFNFCLSFVEGNDFLSFIIKNFRFQVCRLRD